MTLRHPTVSETETICIIRESFDKQLTCYKDLFLLGKKNLSKVILGRGDISPIVTSLTTKQEILLKIETERSRIASSIDVYSKCKTSLITTADMLDLDDKLSQIESAINSFLDVENQIKRYLDCAIGKGAPKSP